MYKIELSISTAMSLHTMSSAGSEEIEEDEVIDEGEENEALAMSDEEFEKMTEEDFASAGDGDDEDNENNDDDESDDGSEDDENLGDDDDDESNENANVEENDSPAEDEGSEQADENDDSEGKQPTKDELTAQATAYEEAYNQLFGTPIKASGREVNLRDVGQARNLIEMGVDYNKKMQHMRPHMQTLKTLEKEGILDNSEQLNLLIEASKGKPEALKKLISAAKIDMLEFADDDNDHSGYVPENHIVSEGEVAIEQAFSAIRNTPSYERTISVMTNDFDAKSKEIMTQNPNYIESLNEDIASGIYDKVMDAVQYQRDTKRIPSTVSDIEAYISTVQQLSAQEQAIGQPNAQAQNHPNDVRQKNTQPASSKRRKVGMSSNRSSTKKSKREYDPIEVMNMSDDDFEKQFGSELI